MIGVAESREKVGTWLGWIASTALGWAVGFAYTMPTTVASVSHLVRLVPLLVANGALVGFVSGIGQGAILRKRGCRINSWPWVSALGHSIAVCVGLAIAFVVPWLAFRARGVALLGEGSGYSFNPTPAYLVLGAFVIGTTQWPVLRHHLPMQGARRAALWIVGAWAAIGLAVLLGGLVRGLVMDAIASTALRGILERALAGSLAGIGSGGVLLILLKPRDSH
jgi:hypothetical protein